VYELLVRHSDRGILRTDLPESDPINVVFVGVGHAHTQMGGVVGGCKDGWVGGRVDVGHAHTQGGGCMG
jgi:hypothetical protein